MSEKVDVCIIGGGVVGLFCALEQAQSGKVVRVIDKLYNGSSRYNMGEIVLKGLPENISEFAKFSREQWSQTAEGLGKHLGYEKRAVARFSLTEEHNAKLKKESEKEKALGFEVEFVESAERVQEILGTDRISEDIQAINYTEGEGAIDTAKALDGLRKMIIQAGVRIWGADEVEKIEMDGKRITNVITDTGEQCTAENYIIATGV
jgi:glycine/D-amino acid oxidase-like deaminating enzyme